tara:strand:- start:216 stop:545 length:330 start_codon:yes stop_codon:yes gene_type:complete
MRHHVAKWDEAAEESHLNDVWEECVDSVLEYGDEVDLFIMEERFNLLKHNGWCDADVIIDDDILITVCSEESGHWELNSWETLMFVSKHGPRPLKHRTVAHPRSNWLVV